MDEEILFHHALEKSPDERGKFLDEAFGGDIALRGRMAAILRAHKASGSFLESPPMPAWPRRRKAGTGRACGPSLRIPPPKRQRRADEPRHRLWTARGEDLAD